MPRKLNMVLELRSAHSHDPAQKGYLVKATIEIKVDSGTSALECFGNQQHKKKLAAEEAAEAALWLYSCDRQSFWPPKTGNVKQPCELT
ncbi:unnamed protein product [Microthlaspi erraticum]|uniref:DRBM domain-containing protein n=1 Tax=Microthlaspi erraticum TaxID=1685480 RepID=A0A6D2IUC1_9BRAS|nr:unnamed protein product [Microthlaspi erraticum]